MQLRNFHIDDYDKVVNIWLRSGLGIRLGDDRESIARKLQRDPELFMVAEMGDTVVGTVIGAFDGRRGWIYHLAVAPEFQRQGIGHKLLLELEKRLKSLGCIKINLLVRPDNEKAFAFYNKIGFACQNFRLMGKEI